jgi:hypothetical protein
MSNLPQTLDSRRPARLCFSNTTPAVLRCPDGQSVASKLQVVSITGGLLSLAKPVSRGSMVKVMFVTQSGPVLGAAEMLSPISYTQQPFRFVALPKETQNRLHVAIQSSLYQRGSEDWWIEKYRTAVKDVAPPRKRSSRILLTVLSLGLLAIGSTLCVLHFHLVR